MASPGIEFKPVPVWRIETTPPDVIALAIEGLAGLADPAHFETYVRWLATPENYGAAVSQIESRIKPSAMAERRCVEIILDDRAPLSLKVFRLGSPFGLFGDADDRGAVIPRFGVNELIANAPRSKQHGAKIVAHLLGFLDTPNGLIAADETSASVPGRWPADSACRLAAALNYIVRTRHGARLRWHLQVRP